MATLATIKNEIHRAACAELDTLLTEAQTLLVQNPSVENWMRIHVFKEYNRKKFNLCGGAGMLTPFDGGLKPLGSLSGSGGTNSLLLEDGSYLLLEDGSEILLE